MKEHTHENGFMHLDVATSGLDHDYDLGEKFERNTDGPSGYDGEPYLLFYVSFRRVDAPGGLPPTFHYALTRSLWRDATEVGDEDRAYLRSMAIARVSTDMRSFERGESLAWLEERGRLYLPA